ncbi:TolC family protein [Mesoterricola sediminis]|uniref:Transporter n=1 Tax=Mesoterricola sediminis TaxID=2927980 RepID=A0AA48H0E3_9BACT|nr:TolC family protein [Mesoterricola sediminis]BDU77342.1 transporter [Mesoterricola sediminis]
MPSLLRILPPFLALVAQAQQPLTLPDAIRQAWKGQTGLQAGEALADKARAEAEALKALRLPTVSLGVGLTRTTEPMQVFGTRLDQARISQMDFMPDRLNHPAAITGGGATLTVQQPLYAGGRLDAAARAGAALAGSETAAQGWRRQQVALAVAQAYFGAQVADQAVRYAEDTLRQAQETERFVAARVEQGLLLRSEGERAKAFRAQSEAGLAEAKARAASARSALSLLTGVDTASAHLSTDLEAPSAPLPGGPGLRGDLEAGKRLAEAARAGVDAAKGALRPEVGLNLTAGTARYALGEGGNWTTASVGAKWTFSFGDSRRVSAARAQARAAELGLQWQTRQASREVEEARRAVETAEAKITFARTAVEASESVRAIRTARHREGLLPLVEVLDAEAGLSGARTLLLGSRLEWRVSRAQLALALGQPIEGVTE